MTQISVELISRGEPTTECVLNSIKKQTFTDYDITCINSSGNAEVSDLLRKFEVKEIIAIPATKLLEARYLAHTNSSGRFRLLLDSTRPLEENALEILISKYGNFSAVCVREGPLGHGFWVKQADQLRSLSDNLFLDTAGENVAYLLPRFYRAETLDKAFKFLKENIEDELFKEISYGEHHLIYEAARLEKNEIAITDEILLKHFEDTKAKVIFEKYRRYGKSQKTLNRLNIDSNAKRLKSHKRPYSKKRIFPMTITIPIRLLRVLAFLSGYIF